MSNELKIMQLPPMPEESNGKLIGLIWDYLKLAKKNPTFMAEFAE